MIQARDQTECKGQSGGKEKTNQSLTSEGLLENSLIQSNTYIYIIKKKTTPSQLFVKLPRRK